MGAIGVAALAAQLFPGALVCGAAVNGIAAAAKRNETTIQIHDAAKKAIEG